MKQHIATHSIRILILSVLTAAFLLSSCSSTYEEKVRSGRMKHDFLYWSGLGDYSKLEATANAFLNGTNECILDVRDRGLKYQNSINCAMLEKLSLAYLDAGGDAREGGEPSVIYATAQSALKYTWMARAISELGGGMQNVWIW